MSFKNTTFRIYAFIFFRSFFSRFNNLLFNFGLRGLGILNYQTMDESGESWFIKHFCKNEQPQIIFDVENNKGLYAIRKGS